MTLDEARKKARHEATQYESWYRLRDQNGRSGIEASQKIIEHFLDIVFADSVEELEEITERLSKENQKALLTKLDWEEGDVSPCR